MNEGSASVEATTIFIDTDGNLKCAPFGIMSPKTTIMTYLGVKPANVDKWQHVSCSY